MKKERRLLLEYRNIIDELRHMGVIRTSKVVGDYGETVVIRALKLTRNRKNNEKGYDTKDKDGKKYEIKTRKKVKWNEPTRFPLSKKQIEHFDFLVLVYFDDNWKLIDVLRIPKTKLEKEDIKKGRILKKNIWGVYKKYSILYKF